MFVHAALMLGFAAMKVAVDTPSVAATELHVAPGWTRMQLGVVVVVVVFRLLVPFPAGSVIGKVVLTETTFSGVHVLSAKTQPVNRFATSLA